MAVVFLRDAREHRSQGGAGAAALKGAVDPCYHGQHMAGPSSDKSVRLNVALEQGFAHGCLPGTMALAGKFRRDIVPKLDADHAEWPFEDRVLVWMLPNMECDALAYHQREGAEMATMFAQHQLEHFDETLAIELLRRVRP